MRERVKFSFEFGSKGDIMRSAFYDKERKINKKQHCVTINYLQREEQFIIVTLQRSSTYRNLC